MRKLIILLAVISLTAVIGGCSKNGNNHDEDLLYGKWQREGTPSDILEFYHKSGQNLVKYNLSTSATPPTMREEPFRVVNGKLEIGITGPSGVSFMTYDSFDWITRGRKFKLNGNERFLFLSSIQPDYIYVKIY